jgi:hypothetical protein
MSEIRSSEPELLGSIINKFLHETGMDETIAEAAMPDVWSEVVGEKISAVTQVLSFAKGRLAVSTPPSCSLLYEPIENPFEDYNVPPWIIWPVHPLDKCRNECYIYQ